ncbi:Protein-tyrosine phosphatase [Teladorsagia circumcincta]|uniref:Protein-tyrosine phosphatase n=1 Tax=Teladorsagia circumcincta TaxID=45464 RepID=A0A2G9V6S6_TELCI|nr:Protein-tyrosine phosphatase [Teladorsagia circumcincta]
MDPEDWWTWEDTIPSSTVLPHRTGLPSVWTVRHSAAFSLRTDQALRRPCAAHSPSPLNLEIRLPSKAHSELKRTPDWYNVKPFIEHTLKTGVAGLITEFKLMKRTNDFNVMTEFVAQIPQGRNRYKDVGCLDYQRVVLNIGPVSYIHANYVSTPVSPKRFICTQAPLPKTCADFWYMVVQEKATAIVMLCNFIEQSSKKSAPYVPISAEESPLNFDGVIVKFRRQEQFHFPINTKVNIRVTHLEVRVPGESPHATTHYHWLDWPDRGVPEADLAPICLLAKIRNTSTPIIVHCSAGIGRTGSIVLIEHALELLGNHETLGEIRSLLLALRKQRNNSIQTRSRVWLKCIVPFKAEDRGGVGCWWPKMTYFEEIEVFELFGGTRGESSESVIPLTRRYEDTLQSIPDRLCHLEILLDSLYVTC